MKLLTEEFLSKYAEVPSDMNELASFVFYRTYSRWLPNEGRRETWKEAVKRAVEYNVGITISQYNKNNFIPLSDKIKEEAEVLFDNIYNRRQFLSGRTHWVGGAETGVAELYPLSNFNCAFIDVIEWRDLTDLFYLLLAGCGVGVKCSKENASKLKPIRTNYTLEHSPYKELPKSERLEETKINVMDNGYAKIYVGDSKSGWVEALQWYFILLTEPQYDDVKHIKISYNSIRPKGERLKTFGGTASGYTSLKDMFEGIDKVIKNQLDLSLKPLEYDYEIDDEGNKWTVPDTCKVRPIHILDMANLIGNNVCVGGVRRTAEIFLCDEDDWEVILAKYGINGIYDKKRHIKIGKMLEEKGLLPDWWYDEKVFENRETLNHRRMSNNSISYLKKPERDTLHLIFELMRYEGEPAFVNMASAKKRRPNAKGLNPCGEVLLDSYGVCNLTTTNVKAFVVPMYVDEEFQGYRLDYQGLMQAQALSVRAGIRMTCLDLELSNWDKVHKRDRLVGCSLTGWKDAMDMLRYNEEQEANLLAFLSDVANNEAIRYSHILRIPTPLLTTTVKPEGTLSKVANGVSSGLHRSESPFYINRVRVSAKDPLAQVALELGWVVNPEVGTKGDTFEEKMLNADTLVIDFPIKSGSVKTKYDQTVEEQFDTYFMFQEHYTAHNSSNTITVKKDEWETAEQIVWDRWDDIIGVTFLSLDEASYELMPYEQITEEQYNELTSKMKPFDYTLIAKYEKDNDGTLDAVDDACVNGACPIR